MKEYFYGTDYELPEGWKQYGVQDFRRQEYWLPIRTAGRRVYHFHAVVEDGDVHFKILYREHFDRENLAVVMDKAAEFCKAYWLTAGNTNKTCQPA